jgi:resolvase-like protein
VIVYNLTRFAREKYDHFALRAHLKSLGIALRSATEPIDDTSTGKLMEGVLAAFAQFDNDVRSDRTRAGMRGPGTRTMDVSGSARILECSEVVRQESRARSRTRGVGEASVRGPGDRTVHEAGSDRTRDRGGVAKPEGPDAVATERRADDPKPDLHRED